MSFIEVPNIEFTKHSHEKMNFSQDVRIGLAKKAKQIHSKYFYDDIGSLIFNEISRLSDYYLTRCECEIFSTYKGVIVNYLKGNPFNLVELGPGEAIKTLILMEELIAQEIPFSYIPIDVSAKYLRLLVKECQSKCAHLSLFPIHSDYFCGLEWLKENSERANCILFLGSSIGNFSPEATAEFLLHLWDSLKQGDFVLIGFDLKKDIDILMKAYQGTLTEEFNLNLLTRMNRELAANFNRETFRHYATYNVYSGAMESYLISLKKQIVEISVLEQSYIFEAIEPIHVEYSFKYLLPQIERLAQSAGFTLIENFTDKNKFFVDSLWRVDK